jgi:adenylate cyclase
MIRSSFSQYLAPSVLSEIENQDYRIELGGEVRDLTVMFTDIRNFTPLTEAMPADELVPLLNDLFTDLSQEVLDQGGTIDKFIGDSLMAFWNAPLPVEDHARKAALASLGMRRALAEFAARRSDLASPIAIGIGLHMGEASVGNIGSRQRFNYSAIGEGVNVAARVEASCKAVGFDIVGSDTVAAAATDLAWLPLGALELKGVGARQGLHALVGNAALARSGDFAALAARHDTLMRGIAEGRDIGDDLAACKALAAGLLRDPDTLYDSLAARPEDVRAVADGL